MAEEVKKTVKKTDAQKEKEKLALQKQKEKEKAKALLQKQKEKEKAKALLQKQKEKEKEKLALQKQKEKNAIKATTAKSPKTEGAASKPKVVIPKSEKKQVEVVEKKSLEDLVKDTKIKKAEIVSDDKPLDHVEILRKKMEAQKKLNENVDKDKTIDKSNDIRAKLQAVSISSDDSIDNSFSETNDDTVINEQIKKLEDTINLLTEEMKNKESLINKQDLEIKDKSEQIIILTNSIVSKTSEQELIKQIEQLKHENEVLKDESINSEKVEETKENEKVSEEKACEEVDISDEAIKEIIAQGDILLRIRLLNERIAEKDAQIQLVEDELNKLSEKDIVALNFTQQIKQVRGSRKELIERANVELKDLSGSIKNTEDKINSKKALKEENEKEIKAFDKEISEKKLSYTEKEEQMNKRSRIIASFDALSNEVFALEEDYKKLVNRYKKVLKQAEEHVEEYNKHESDLISLYLKQLRDEKSAGDENYQNQKEERELLLGELDKLNKVYEEMKARNIEDNIEINAEELDAMKKEYAKLTGKLNVISMKYDERVNVEEVLRTIDPEVSSYLKAFSEKERLDFDIAEEKARLNDSNKERLELIINDNNNKIEYLNGVISSLENNEKVVFYKQLLKSMDEIKDKEAILKNKVKELKQKIEKAEDNQD